MRYAFIILIVHLNPCGLKLLAMNWAPRANLTATKPDNSGQTALPLAFLAPSIVGNYR